ncbi:FecR family protein [Chitinophaga sancti]|uniref:FecR family protein n=1 Tax=Chitinophaga sancti TaxID=1004 RepID=UPI002A756991|nr:FecR family protein [Chitinophaga sancti]WPQ63000.1 FecR family protein [Chitinophaga sancti]
MNSKDFKHILDQYTAGQPNEQLEAWLDAMEDKTAFDSLSPEELQASKDATFRRLQHRIEHKRPVFYLYKVAAAVALLIVAGYIFKTTLLNLVAPHRKTYATSVEGKITKQILSDGTIVWLKGESKLVFPVKFGGPERAVTLDGEALFEVTKDVNHPFLIYCGSLTTKVLGTSFNIKKTGQQVAISVLTGAVSLNGENILIEHENAVYSEAQATVTKGHATREAVHELTKGTEYDMAFNDASMEEVIQRIEKKFEIDIQTNDTTIANSLFTADLTDQSLNTTMEMISQALNLEVTIKGRTVLMEPKK